MPAPHPFNTKKPLTEDQRATYDAIDTRLKALEPAIDIKDYIDAGGVPLKNAFSSLEAHKSTLDGINFTTSNPKGLSNAFYQAKDGQGELAFASMKEDPKHWALKKSFGVTVGTGWREIWRPKEHKYSKLQSAGLLNPELKMRFGSAGVPFNFSALHCSVNEKTGEGNIHIDEAGFVLEVPSGFAVTADAYQHIMDELLFKTILRDWLNDHIDHAKLAKVVGEVIRTVSIKFPNSFNGFAGVSKTVNSFKRPTTFGGALRGLGEGTLNLIKPVGMSVEAYRRDDLLVQVNYMKVDSQVTLTLTVGGRF